MANQHDPRNIATNPFKKTNTTSGQGPRRTGIQPAGHEHLQRRPNYPKPGNQVKV
jgi:hypothetical protein